MLGNHTTESVTNSMTQNYEKARKNHELKSVQFNKEASALIKEREELDKRISNAQEMASKQYCQAMQAQNAIKAIKGWANSAAKQ